MFRPKMTVYLLAPVLVAVAVLSGACGASHPEQQPLQQFFRASGMRDDQTLSNFAAVSFDPKTDGTVTAFTITSVSEVKTISKWPSGYGSAPVGAPTLTCAARHSGEAQPKPASTIVGL